MKHHTLIAAVLILAASCASTGQKEGANGAAAPAAAAVERVPGERQVFKKAALESWDRPDVAGGRGILAGEMAFTRNNADPLWVIRETGWLSLKSGDSVGLHAHQNNDDAYIIISGQGEFTGSDGKTVPVGPGDITIAHGGQSHALKNTGSDLLLFYDVFSKPVEEPTSSWAGEPQVFHQGELQAWDRTDVAGGKGKLAGKFSYTRNDEKTFPLYEIGWMTLAAGDAIGLHAHENNEDAYIIVSGTGEFTGSDGKAVPVGPGDITIARAGQKHGLANTGSEDLVFLDIVAK